MSSGAPGFISTPYRRHTKAGTSSRHGSGDDEDKDCSGPFDNLQTESVRIDGWRLAVFALKACCRFLYLKKEEERKQLITKFRAYAVAIRAAKLFQAAAPGVSVSGTPTKLPATRTDGNEFEISQEVLALISKKHDFSILQQYGGVEGVADKLQTNLEEGIHGDETDILKRKNAFGFNTYPHDKGRSFWKFLWDACGNKTLITLMVVAAVSSALGILKGGIKERWYDSGGIMLAVIIVTVIRAISAYKLSLQFQCLNEEKRNIRLEVMRGGRRVSVSIFDIVVGDVVPLKVGDQVPADGLLIPSRSRAIDESSMAGESKNTYKVSKAPFLIYGTKVADGNGTMLVTSLGINTASILEDNGKGTPLQVQLIGVQRFIGIVGVVDASAALIVLMARYFIGLTKNPDGSLQFKAGQTSVRDAIDGAIKIVTVAVANIFVAVPEELPLVVTLTLAYSMRKMIANKALVRLSACETMGSATTICTDKTGVLTTLMLNQMTVVEAYVCGEKIDPRDNKSSVPARFMSLLIEGIVQNTTAGVFMPEGGIVAEASGSPIDKAILQWGVNLSMNFDAIQPNSSIIHVFPFNLEKKRGGVAVKLPDSGVHIYLKGAAETILASCTSYIDEDDNVVPMDKIMMSFFKKAIEDMVARRLRCVAIAYRSYESENVPTNQDVLDKGQLLEEDLVLLAIVGIEDPCQPGVRDAVQLCVKAGIKVRMVTGDDLQTAKAIALECGILQSDSDAIESNLIEGKRFRDLSESERQEVAENISVMGRSSPNDKLLLVQALKKRGEVVAVIGDGTNDAPALCEADVGLVMGIAGTEVEKVSPDIIILDGNFASVVKVVRWGRSVYANCQKVIQFLLTAYFADLIMNLVSACSSVDVSLNAVQLLWVSLIMDTLGAFALATEPPIDRLMHRPPVGRRELLITNVMWRNSIIQALYQVTVLLVLNIRGKSILEHDTLEHMNKVKSALTFNAFVLLQIFNEFNARNPDEINVFKGVHKNHVFISVVGLTSLLQVIIVMFLGKFTSTVRLSWKLWLVSIAIGFISWPLAIIGKLIPVPKTPFVHFFTRHCRRNRRGCSIGDYC